MMNKIQIILATRLIQDQIDARTRNNNTIRKTFGDRITGAYAQECAQRDSEIEALTLTIAAIEALDDDAS